MSECIWYLSFWVWMTSLNMMFSRSIHSICLQISRCHYFFCCVLLHCLNVPIFLNHSLVQGNFDCFQVWAMTNNVVMNIVEHISLWYDWTSFGFIPKSGIVGSWDRLFPNFLRNCHTYIQRGYTSLHSHLQCKSVSFNPQPLQYKLSSVLWSWPFLQV